MRRRGRAVSYTHLDVYKRQEQHIEWLKRYLLEYANAFILISHDIPFLNSVVNIIYHMENQSLDRYVGDYDKFVEVHAVKKAQLEAAYKRQQQEIAEPVSYTHLLGEAVMAMVDSMM